MDTPHVSTSEVEDTSWLQRVGRQEGLYRAIVKGSREGIGTAPAFQSFNVPGSPAQAATSLQSRRDPPALFVAGLLELAVGVLISLTLLLCLTDLAREFF
jgi:hypothetical protein